VGGFVFTRVLNWAFLLGTGGIFLLMGIGLLAAAAFGRRNPAARPSLVHKALVIAWIINFSAIGTYLSITKNIGDLVGGTTDRGNAELAADGKYYLYAWWRPGKRTAVSPEKFRALYRVEHLPISPVGVACFVFMMSGPVLVASGRRRQGDASSPTHRWASEGRGP
jgi:hypothetical protein